MEADYNKNKAPMEKSERILFVEDEPLSRWVVRKGLENAGFFVVDAGGCERGLALVDTMSFDAVVLDHRLSDGLGLDILRRMRATNKRQKVIYLTAEPEEISASLRRDLDIAAVLSKPVEMADLVRVLRSFGTDPGAGGACTRPAQFPGEVAARVGAGRFELLKAPAIIGLDFVKLAMALSDTEPWLAMDLTQTIRIEPESFQELCSLAVKCRAGGGRLCLVGADDRMRAVLQSAPLRCEADLYPDVSWLESAGRRISSECERGLLIKSVVREGAR